MKSTELVFSSAVCILFTFCSAHADECRDVLLRPIYDISLYKRDNYVNTSIMANIDQIYKSDTSSKTDVGIKIPGIPISLNLADTSKIKSILSEKYDFEFVQKETTSVMLMSGQEKL